MCFFLLILTERTCIILTSSSSTQRSFEQTLVEAIKQEYPFSPTPQKDLKEYQQYLGLRDEDIASIEKRVLSPKKAEYERDQQQAEKLLQQEQQIKSQEQDSFKGVNRPVEQVSWDDTVEIRRN